MHRYSLPRRVLTVYTGKLEILEIPLGMLRALLFGKLRKYGF